MVNDDARKRLTTLKTESKKKRSFLRKLLCAALIITPVIFFAGLFYLRDPVLVVNDAFFSALYGPKRLLFSRIDASLRLFRPVKAVTIAENAGADIVVLALEDASPRPFCVIAPNRYAGSLRRYAEKHPEIDAGILGDEDRQLPGRAPVPPSDSSLLWFSVDRNADYYRAGLAAGLFAQGEGRILVFYNTFPLSGQQEALRLALREQGYQGEPEMISSRIEYSSFDDVSCVILAGHAPEFFNRNLNIPVILFSWIDPAKTSRNTRVIFDDSHWTLTVPMVLGIKKSGPLAELRGRSIPSKMKFMPERIENKGFKKLLKSFAKRTWQTG
ncbi:MAG: hypothetical protein LBE10_07840 [Treponema sp.]|jgi:hypothetical protein|nr:hypothetical protein [Treponema sp.]